MSNLSPAQLQERRDAARARWDKARQATVVTAAGLAGGAAAGFGVNAAVQAVRQDAAARRQHALSQFQSAFEAHHDRLSEIDARFKRRAALARNNAKFLEIVPKVYSAKYRLAADAEGRLRQHIVENSEHYFDSTSGEETNASLDLPGENKLRVRVAALKAGDAQRFKDIADKVARKGRNEYSITRPARFNEARVESFTRTRRSKPLLVMSHVTQKYIESALAEDAAQLASGGNELSIFHELNIKSLDDLQNHFLRLNPGDRTGFAAFLKQEASVPNIKISRKRVVDDVKNVSRFIPEHKAVVPGYPSRKDRTDIRNEMVEDLKDWRAARVLAQIEHAKPMLEAGRLSVQASKASFPYRATRAAGAVLARTLPRRGIIGSSIGAGILSGAFLANQIERRHKNNEFSQSKPLAKSDDDATDSPTPKKFQSTAARLLIGAEDVENAVARGVGRAFASWKEAATPENLADLTADGSLFDRLDEPLAAGMEPLDQATLAGLTAPSIIDPHEPDEADTSNQRLIHFGFNLRSTDTADFAKRYRYSRVRELTTAQRKNIGQIMQAAQLTGDPPAVTAKKIRDVVGLTAKQAQAVSNYRLALETNDPRATTFALRDRRYDRSIQAAIDSKKPLADAKVDDMVDAYSRRFLAYRAMTIARTESLRASNNGHADAVTDWLGKNPEFTVAKTWISTEDHRTRPDHVGLDRQTVIGLQTPFIADSGDKIRWPHDPKGAANQVINCFHPDTIIQGNVLCATRAVYSGAMRKITTRGGSVLTVTPHHPIATSKGFVDAVTLSKGDNLIRYIGGQNDLAAISIGDDKNNKPTSIQQIFDTLALKWGTSSVKVRSHDFHGDAEFFNNNVDIVCSYGKLPIDFEAAIGEMRYDVSFTSSNSMLSSKHRFAGFFYFLNTSNTPLTSDISLPDLSIDQFRCFFNFDPLKSLSFGTASNLNFSLSQQAGQDISVESTLIRQFFERSPINIAFDEIIDILDFDYFGHVYDVETTSKCVFAQDILASNCRCTFMTVLIPRTAAAKYGPGEYKNPTADFWNGPRQPFTIDDPSDLLAGVK